MVAHGHEKPGTEEKPVRVRITSVPIYKPIAVKGGLPKPRTLVDSQSAESAIGFGRRLQRRDIPILEHLEQPKRVAKL